MRMSGPRMAAAIAVFGALGLAGCGERKPAEPAAEAPAAAAKPAGFLVYVTNENSNDISVIDGATNQLVATTPIGMRPRGIRATADGKTLYVALSGSPAAPPGVDESKLPPPDRSKDGIGVFDTAARKLVRTIKGPSDPEQLGVGPNGKIYVASEDSGQAVILNAADGATLKTIKVGDEPEGVSVTPDGRFVYMTSEEDAQVAVIDTQTDTVVKFLKVGERPRDTAFSPDGSRGYITGEFGSEVTLVNARTHQVQKTVKIPGEDILPMGAVVSPDGSRVYVTTGRGGLLVALDGATLAVVAQVKVGRRPWGLAMSPDGRFIYTANGPSNDVSVVDTASMTVVTTVKVGERPWGVAIGPAPQ